MHTGASIYLDGFVHKPLTVNIATLWRHASLVGVFNDEKNGDPNVQIRRFAVPVRFGTEVRYASIMAKETLDEQQHRVCTRWRCMEKKRSGVC